MINKAIDYINLLVDVIIDRPLNSLHPKHGFRYETNYGFVPNTIAPDGEELDAYILGVEGPLEKFHGKCIAVIHRTNDHDDKLVIIPEDVDNISDEEIKKSIHFQEQYFESVIIRNPEPDKHE